ncbi:MAG: DNA primase [Anaerovoracaceae bacterium]|jgi:DNA primase
MAFSYSSASIENLKSQVNIVDVIGRVVPLKKAGSNFKGLCPFHKEKTPSFSVSEDRQYFKCFGCGAAGDVIEFEKKYYNLDFVEAVEKLADEYGIHLEKTAGYDDTKQKRLYEINRLAARYFYRAFTQTKNPGYTYMTKRGIEPRTLKIFGIGYADGDWHSLMEYLKSKGVDEKTMLELGLISESRGKLYDKFRNRVMFPIINTSGRVIGFGGRAIRPEDNPKYLNSPENLIFHKKNNLYALNFARKAAGEEGFLILVEGYMDAISLYQSGIRNTAASLGTALTEQQARLIHRYTGNVVLSYDADNAGRKAALRGIEILNKEGCKVRVLHVTDGKDPDEFVKKNGRDAFLELTKGALTYAEYKLDAQRQGLDMTTEEGRAEYIKRALMVIEDLDPVEGEFYKKRLADEFGLTEEVLDREQVVLDRKTRNQRTRPERRRDGPETSDLAMSLQEQTLIRIALEDPRYFEQFRNYPGLITSPFARKILSLYEEAEGDDPSEEILTRLTPDEFTEVRRIQNTIPITGGCKAMFKSCVNDWKRRELRRKEQDLRNQLSIADSEHESESSNQILRELVQVQKKMKELKR